MPACRNVSGDSAAVIQMGRRVARGRGRPGPARLAVAADRGDRLALPEPAHGWNRGVHRRVPLAVNLGAEREVLGIPPRGEREVDAARGEVVDHGPLLDDPHRVVERQDHAPRPEPDPAGLHRQGGMKDRGIGIETPKRCEMPFGKPDCCKALAVREPGALDQQPVLLGRRPMFASPEEHQAKRHRRRPGALHLGPAARSGQTRRTWAMQSARVPAASSSCQPPGKAVRRPEGVAAARMSDHTIRLGRI